MQTLEVAFQVWFKAGGAAGREHSFSEVTNVLDADRRCREVGTEVPHHS